MSKYRALIGKKLTVMWYRLEDVAYSLTADPEVILLHCEEIDDD